VNKQAVYITQAHLLLVILATGFWFVSKIPSNSVQQDNQNSNPVIDSEIANILSPELIHGKNLFMSKCAACHSIFKDMTGPALGGFEERGFWRDRKKLYEWIKNPEAFMVNDSYTKGLKAKFGSVMTSFPGITNEEIDAIAKYINAGNVYNKSLP
jgi:cytochrome c1